MKKVAIITRHAIANYGSLLQTIALQNQIEKLGYKAEIINFIRNDETILNKVMTDARMKKKWNRNIVTRYLYCLIRMPVNIYGEIRFKQYRKKYLNLTKRYESIEALRKNKPKADVYMTGSDQVWGPILNGKYESAYFLDFCNENDKRVSYAASFGKTNFVSTDKDKYIQMLNKYNKITVREDSAVELLNKEDIKSKQVIDPTLLLTPMEWEKLLGNSNRKISEKYAVVYQIHNNKELEKYAKEFAKKAGIKLIRISPSLHQIFRGGKFVYTPTLGEFVSYIKHAEYVITDSFHGTVFSINFNTPLVTLLPKTGTSTRNTSILRLMGLEKCIVGNVNDFRIIQEKIDFKNANRILDEQRKNSIHILNELIEDHYNKNEKR